MKIPLILALISLFYPSSFPNNGMIFFEQLMTFLSSCSVSREECQNIFGKVEKDVRTYAILASAADEISVLA